MATLAIRDVPESVVQALDVQASAAGKSREAWLREYLIHLANEPIIREIYRINVFRRVKVTDGGGIVTVGLHDNDGYILHETMGYIQRDPAEPTGARYSIYNPLPDELTGFNQALEFVRRNGPGDREHAIATLERVFDVVWETPPKD